MGRLYPRMRERPPEYRFNRDSPLFSELRAFYTADPAESIIRNHATGNRVPLWVFYNGPYYSWSSELNRPVLDFRTTTYTQPSGYIERQLYVPSGSGYSIAAWAYPRTGIGFRSTVLLYSGVCVLEHYPTGYMQFRITVSPFPIADAPLSLNEWQHFVGTCSHTFVRIWKNGVFIAETAITVSPSVTYADASIGTASTGTAYGWCGQLADIGFWSRPLSAGEIAVLADPSNVDLRVGGVPLILPPRRRLFPSVEIPAPTFNPAWAQHVNTYIGLGS